MFGVRAGRAPRILPGAMNAYELAVAGPSALSAVRFGRRRRRRIRTGSIVWQGHVYVLKLRGRVASTGELLDVFA